MVEAAGVEPASESTYPWDSTCVSALEISPVASKSRRNCYWLAPKTSHRSASARHVTTSLLKWHSIPPHRLERVERRYP